jgi:putative DNA primase/helicase
MSIARHAKRYCELSLALTWTFPGSKGPRHTGWNVPANAITDPAAALRYWTDHPTRGVAALLGPSGLVSLDIDDEERSRIVLAHFGIHLTELRATAPCIVGRHFRIVYAAPTDVELKHRTLGWPKQNNPKASAVVLEFRAGNVADTMPPTRHVSTGLAYRWDKPFTFFPPLPARLLELWQDWPRFSAEGVGICPWAPPPKAIAPPKPRAAPFTGDSVISRFNAAHDVGAILEAHGYVPKGKRYTAPDSQHAAGVSVLDDGRVYCHHQGDALADGHAHDAFDVYRVLDHGGDLRAAVEAAAHAVGLNIGDVRGIIAGRGIEVGTTSS